jgi:hypothetical protein
MEFNIRIWIIPLIICNVIAIAVAEKQDSVVNSYVKSNDSVTISGMILDSVTGAFPQATLIDPMSVKVDSIDVTPDSEGIFSVAVPRTDYHVVRIITNRFLLFSLPVSEVPDKKNYFVTCSLHPAAASNHTAEKQGASDNGPCWIVSGCIVDSKHDLAIKPDSDCTLTFDDSLIEITKHGGFVVTTCQKGRHTFHVKIPGYHEAIEQLELTSGEKQPFVTIPTTKLENTVNRREITVSAKREPLHTTASVSKIQIDRNEIVHTAATLDDPVRAVQTLPGVASTSDASSRPIVREGEPRETRVFLDGIPLVQPYHFGGFHSMFNELSIDNITLYKSDFPAEFHNAQSALMVVDSRKPAEEPYALALNCNLLQTDAYVGIPLFDKKVGINTSFQTSYYDFFYKRILDVEREGNGTSTNTGVGIKQLENDVHLPDYLDFSTGIEIKPNDKFRLYFNEIYNTDNYKAISRSTYGYGGEDARRDTFVDYKSYYNILYGTARYLPSAENIVTVSGAWQKRWWDLKFPAPFSVFYDTSLYNVTLSQFNGKFQWLYSGLEHHILGAGLQVDYNKALYNVNVARIIHQVILDGNTNFADFLGPITNDNGLTLVSDRFNTFDLMDMMKHLFIKYNGDNHWYNGGFFVQDEWNITPRLSSDVGARVEFSDIDKAATVSPRVSAKYSLSRGSELIASAGLYTQNNYDISSIALSNDLKPEKVWHGSIGEESRLLPWLTQKVDFYGKYYYDLITEVIQGTSSVPQDSIYQRVFGPNYPDSLGAYAPQMLSDIATEYRYSNDHYESRFTNQGRGYAYGLEYFLRYDPADFWNGWISLSLAKSMRRDNPWWRWYPFSLDRPVVLSLVNYYRLPRTYEVSVKYRFMSGVPYTSVMQDSNGTRIGTAGDSRYSPYQRLDFKFSKGFTIKDSKGHFYIEIWNAFNTPNFALTDSKTRQIIAFDANWLITMLFFGIDYQF